LGDIYDQIAQEAVSQGSQVAQIQAPTQELDIYDQIAQEAVSQTPISSNYGIGSLKDIANAGTDVLSNPSSIADFVADSASNGVASTIFSRLLNRDQKMGVLKGVARAGSDVVAAPADLVYRGGNYLLDKATGENTDLTGGYPSDYRNQFLDYISGGEGDKRAEAATQALGNIATVFAAPSQAKNIANNIPILSKLAQGKDAGSNIASIFSKAIGYGVEGAGISALMNPKSENLGEEMKRGAEWNIAIPAAMNVAERTATAIPGKIKAVKEFIKDTFKPDLEAKAKEATLETLQQYTDLAKLKTQLELVHPTTPPVTNPPTSPKAGILDNNPFASTFTTAEKINNEELGLLTKVLENKIPEAGIKKTAMDVARANKRSEIFKAAQGPTVSNEQVGKLIQKGLGDNADELSGAVSTAYKTAEAGDLVAPIAQAKVSIKEELAKQLEDFGPIDTYSSKVIEKFMELPDNLSMSQLQYARKQVGKLHGDLDQMLNAGPDITGGKRLLASLFGKLDEAEKASISPTLDNWLLPQGEQQIQQIAAVKAARKLAQEKGETFGERAAGEILRKGRYGKLEMLPSDVAKTAVRSPEDARQVMKGLNYNPGKTVEARQALGSNLLDELVPSMGEFNARSFANKWDKLEPSAKEVLSRETIAAVEKVKGDLIGESAFNARVGNASKGQSATSQRMGAASFAKDTILEAVRSKTGPLGKLFEVIGSDRATKIESMVDEALTKIAFDSKYAKDFLNTAPSKEAVEKISKEAIKKIIDKEFLSRITIGTTSAIMSPGFKEKQKQESLQSKVFSKKGEKKMPSDPATIKKVEAKIDSDPVDATIYEMESSRNPLAKNTKSTASGAFQLIKKTQQAFGVTDPFDIEQNYGAYKKLRKENEARFGSNPILLYSAHYLGATVLDKVLKGKTLTEDEQAQVKELENKILPKFEALYKSKLKGTVEA